MDVQTTGADVSGDQVERILWSARRAGTLLIVPRDHSAAVIAAMTEWGLLRRQLGHIVVTPKGQEQRRRCTQPLPLTA